MNYLKPETSLIEPFAVDFNLAEGVMLDPTSHLVRRASDMKGYYADKEALERLIKDGNPVHYEVFEKPIPGEYWHIMYCISKLQPGLVGNEYFMTKGHYHSRINTGEIYLALRGTGLMLMMTPDGGCRHETLVPGRMVYVPPYWGHRSINTGREPLISFCVYPGDAGHNYGGIEKDGFPKRAYEVGDRVVVS
jgi:glucose-6-phosphate isomerase